jgi:hypothetical protein
MGRQLVGSMFCICAAILFATRYIGAAASVSPSNGNVETEYTYTVQAIGSELLVLSIIALLVGLVYVGWGEYDRYRGDE